MPSWTSSAASRGDWRRSGSTQRLRLNPGAERLVRACQEAGLKTLLVSGGFTYFTDRLCERLGIDRSTISVAALGPRIAGMAGDGWQSVHTSSHPRDAELLALVEQLCQTGAG